MKEIQTQRINYLDALRAYPKWEALITEKERYTFRSSSGGAERVGNIRKKEEKQENVTSTGSRNRRSRISLFSFWHMERKYGSSDCTRPCKISDELRDVTPPEGHIWVYDVEDLRSSESISAPLKKLARFFKLQNKIFKMGEETLRLCREA